ncbi:ABC transporter permease [Geovibrio sp. ADMFC3]
MNLFTIPLKNLRRKLLRTAMLTLVFSAGIISVVGLYYVSATVGESLEQKLTAYGANILIRPHSENLDVSYGGFSMGNMSYNVHKLDMDTVHDGVMSIGYKDRISAIAPKLLESSSVNGKEFAVVGINWIEELKIKSYWYIDTADHEPHGQEPESLPETADMVVDGLEHGSEFGKYDIIAGNTAAKLLGLEKGRETEIEGKTFNVAGVLAPMGTDEDRLVFMDITALQELKNKPGEVTFVEVSALCSGCPIDDIVAQIKLSLPDIDVTAMQSVVKQRMFTVNFVKNLVLVISGVILVIACFMLAVFMMASVAERKSEIGILRSMGYSRAKIFCLFSFESLVIGASSGLAGFAAGYFTAVKILEKMELTDGAAVHFEPAHLLLSVGIVCVVSIAASVIPALKAARTEPASAIIRL